MRPGTSMMRFTVVMGATMAAIVGLALAIGAAHPLLALGLTVGICIISSAVLPSATWVKFTDLCRWAVWQLDRRGLKPPRCAVILTLGAGGSYVTDWLVMPAHLTAGLVTLAVIWTVAILAMWRPGRDTIRQWRDERLEERRLSRQLLEMDAHDSEDFNGRDLPRKDWAAFNEALAGVLREMRSSEEPGK